MKKASMLLVGVLVLGLAAPTFAAETVFDWTTWHKERVELQKEVVDSRVEAGLITEAQADLWKQTMDTRQEAIEANPEAFVPGAAINNGTGYGFGMGRRGGGRMMGGYGQMGGYGMMGGGFGPAFAR